MTRRLLMLWFALLMIGSLSACRAQAYTPQTDASIPAGEQRFSSLTIPEGVSVLLEGDSVLHVVGEVVISGRLIGDCTRLEIRAGGAVTVSGLISNACEGDERAADLIILVEGDLTLGAAPSPEPVLISSGSIELRSVRGEGLDSDALFSEPAALLPLQSFLKWYSAAQPAGKETFIFNRPLEPGSAGDLKIVSGDLNDNIEVDVFVNTNLRAGDGSAAPAMGAAGRCENSQAGGKGGDVLIVVPQGTLHLAAGVILRAGDGGKGGNCVATSGCPALAHSGTGGAGGDVLLYVQNAELHPESVAAPGDGGPGGDARALGDDADAPCGEGCAAEADGGEGGRGGRYDLRSSLDIRFDPIPAVHGSNGGPGGWAHAIAGDGAACPDCPGGVGGEGGLAVARGGQGGNFGYATDYLIRFAEGARQVGAGGDAHAFPGNGGEGASCCRPPAVGGPGGEGGNGVAVGGMFGGTGDFPGVRGVAHMQGGQGGDGGDGDPPGAGGSGGLLEGDPEGFPNGTDGFVGSYCKVAPAWDAYFLVSVRHDVQTAVSWLEILISVLAGDPEPLPGASVTVRMTRPDGGDEVLTGVTGPDGTVELTFEISVYGDYTLTVEDIQAAGYVYMPELNAASSVTARVGPAEGPLAVGDDRLRAFYEEFNAAFAAGDHETLYTGLHPAVLERYGESTCRGYLENVVASPLEVDQISLEDFGAWIWETDGLASEIAHTYTMLGRVTAAGASAEQDLHLALRDDGSLSWFSDCGDPLP